MSDLIYRETHPDRAVNSRALSEEQQRNLDWAAWSRDRFAEELAQGTGGEAIITLILDRRDNLAAELRKEFCDELAALREQAAEVRGALNVLKAGRVLNPRGLYDSSARYEQMDLAVVGGSSFVAIRNDPGPLPGDGWKLVAGVGKRGPRGYQGKEGERGQQGERGAIGSPAPAIATWRVDRQRYTLRAVYSDGTLSAEMNLRPLFEQFVEEVRGGR
jgi:hypothetical protein